MPSTPTRALVLAACVTPVTLFLIVYLVLPFHGFMIDDYGWILRSRVRGFGDFARLFTETTGFYRPVVGLSFAVDEAIFGNAAFGYAATNVMLALACGGAIAWLGRALGLGRGAAIFAACVWLLNTQGLRTAVLWLSGRTELLVTLGLTLAAAALVRDRPFSAFGWLTIALLSKEEAVVFPLVLLAWLFVLRSRLGPRPVSMRTWTIGSSALTVTYLVIRHAAGAMTPQSAPDSYRLAFIPGMILRHAYIYSDQILTFALAVTLIALLVLRPSRPWTDQRARLIAALGTIWVVGGYALTILVPSRSDLYSCLPSVGVALAAAAMCERAWLRSGATRRSDALVAVLVGCVVLSPVYYLRTQTRGHLMAFGARALAEVARAVAPLPPGSLVTVYDDEAARNANLPNLEDAFAGALPEAYQLVTGRHLRFTIGLAGDQATAAEAKSSAMTLWLRDGHVGP